MKSIILILCSLLLVALGLVYASDPAIEAVKWQAPTTEGYKGRFAPNTGLLPVGLLDLSGHSGPEDVTVNSAGVLYVSTAHGHILKFNDRAQQFEPWAFTGGYPLGIRFDAHDNMIVADAALGLLKINPQQQITILANQYQGQQLGFVDALDIDDNGIIYFSDASRKFSPRDFDGPKVASELDIFEHGSNGRIYSYNSDTGSLTLLIDNLHFANGVSLTPDQQSLLVVETAKYRVLKYTLHGERQGSLVPLIDNLPGFPDNIVAHPHFGYWLGLTAPRSQALDTLSQWPRLRGIVSQLPQFLRPSAQRYGHIVHVDESGQVLESLQDPSGSYAMTTGALQINNKIYITSLDAKALAVLTLR